MLNDTQECSPATLETSNNDGKVLCHGEESNVSVNNFFIVSSSVNDNFKPDHDTDILQILDSCT